VDDLQDLLTFVHVHMTTCRRSIDKTENSAHSVNVPPKHCQSQRQGVTVRRMPFSPMEWVSEDLLKHPKHNRSYVVRIRWASIGGRMEPVEIQFGTVQPAQMELQAPGGHKPRAGFPEIVEATRAVHLNDLREIGLQALIDRERSNGAKRYVEYVRLHGKPPGPDVTDGIERWTWEAIEGRAAEPFTHPARRGPDVTPDEYQMVAEIYQRAYAAGENPREAVAEHYSISPDAAAKRVQRARERGWLPPTERGRARAVGTKEKVRGSKQ
jgi:hypothetical protein